MLSGDGRLSAQDKQFDGQRQLSKGRTGLPYQKNSLAKAPLRGKFVPGRKQKSCSAHRAAAAQTRLAQICAICGLDAHFFLCHVKNQCLDVFPQCEFKLLGLFDLGKR